MMMMSSFFAAVMLFLFWFAQMSTAMGHENRHFIMELGSSSRAEMVQLAGYGEEKLSSVLVSGTVLCKQQACLDGDDQLRAWPVSDASVAVTCKTGGKRRNQIMSQAQGTTDEYGDFIIDLPSHLHANPNLDKACTVRVIRLPKNSPCSRRIFVRKPKGIRFSSIGNSIRMYTAGTITFKQPSKLCLKKGDTEEKTSW